MAEGPGQGEAGGSAMQRAVVAEQEARRAIAEAEGTARADVEAARAQARAILNAVPARIAKVRVRGANAVRGALAQIEAEEAQATAALRESALPEELLGPATQALVARLTGGTPGESS